jgi:hypothetical protein
MERRSFSRVADSQTILLFWEERSETRRQLGKVTAPTSGGLSVLADHAIQVGTAISLSCLSFFDFASPAIVNHLSRQADRYFIGIEFPSSIKTAPLEPKRWAA